MRELCAVMTLTMTAAAHAEIVDGTFDITGSDTVTRFFHRAGVLADGKVLVSGGMRLQIFPPSLFSRDDLSVYDPGTGLFTTLSASLATPRSSHTQTTLLDGRVLLTGGRAGASGTNPGSAVASVEIYDPATGDVCPGPPMSSSRAGHTASRLPDGRVLVAGGGAWQLFDPGPDTWSGALPLQHSRADHAAAVLTDGRVLLAGGSGSGPATLEIVDPAAGASTLVTATLATPVDDLRAAPLDDGTVLIAGGQDLGTGDTVADAYVYDPAADTLTSVPDPPGVPGGVADHALVPLGRYVLLAGGEQQAAGNDTELSVAALFDRVAAAWIALPAMSFPHDDAAAAPLADGRVLIVDGGVPFIGQEAPSTNVEVFAPLAAGGPDLDCDGGVDVDDLVIVIVHWGPCAGAPSPCAGDADGDGDVDVDDLVSVITNWG